MTNEALGVWADPHSLLVRTPGFALLFERAGRLLSATLTRIELGDETVIFETRALACIDPARARAVLKARDPESGSDLVFDNDIGGELRLEREELDIAVTDRGLVLGRQGRTVERLAGNRLRLTLPSGRPAALGRVERIQPAAPLPGAPADPDTLARSLQAWALGTGVYRNPEGTYRSFTIGTNRFSFGFSYGAIGDDDILHCRAARVRASAAGVVFAPLFRLVAHRGRLVADADDDLAAVAAQDLPAGPAPAGGSRTPGLAPEWWSIRETGPDAIELESPAGARYRLARPVPDNPALVEWFGFLDYDAAVPLLDTCAGRNYNSPVLED